MIYLNTIHCRNIFYCLVLDEEYEGTNDDLRQESNESRQKFFEVDAFGDDYVDFGASTGQNGAFMWHANFPLE